jgi:hypothetical protein
MVGVTVPKRDRLWRMGLLTRIDVLGRRSCLRKYRDGAGLSVRQEQGSRGVMGRKLGAVQSQHSSRNRTKIGVLCKVCQGQTWKRKSNVHKFTQQITPFWAVAWWDLIKVLSSDEKKKRDPLCIGQFLKEQQLWFLMKLKLGLQDVYRGLFIHTGSRAIILSWAIQYSELVTHSQNLSQ